MRYNDILLESAATELAEKLPGLRKPDYDSIDQLMRRISKRHSITGDKLHKLFVKKYGHTPDTWIKKYKEKLEEANNGPVEENLHQWFKEKWVRFGPDGKIRGACARGDDSEGKPKCLPQAKAHALGKKRRASAATKKRREDPNPERSGPAKNVATKVREDDLNELSCWSGYHRVKGVPAGAPGSCAKNESMAEEHEYCPECGGAMYPDTMINEKKDACYYKVKSRYKVWPSAYASGALVKCRKKGASNWGNKSESVAQDQLDEKWSEKYKRSIDCNNPKGFSQRAHCQGRAKNEAANPAQQAAIAINMKKHHQKPKNEGVAEGAKVDRMKSHIAKSERKLGKSKKEAENIAWATLNKRGYLDNKNKKVHESVEGKDDIQQIKDFIHWSVKQLNVQKPLPKFTLSRNTMKAQAGHHTGVHREDEHSIWVYIGGRNMIDIFRTIFHELVHERQSQLNMIEPGDSYPGSPIEAMADMMAGKYIKIYGKDHPEIFQ